MVYASKLCKSALPVLAPIIALAAGKECRREDIDTQEWYNKMQNNYFNLWAGDLNLAEQTLHPDVYIIGDRFPNGKTNSTELTDQFEGRTIEDFIAFVERSRQGWEEYYFEVIHSVANDYNIAIRWRMHGTLSEDFNLFPTTREPGEQVSYNGTEYVTLDKCTGLINTVATAQDLIYYFWTMGLPGIPIKGMN